MEDYLVTIGVPIYGVAKYIERCAISLFEQTYSNIEYVFVDDCTPDNSVDLLKQVLEKYPQRKNQVKIIRHEKNKGLAGARNTVLDKATGDFILHVDSDDYIDTGCIAKLVEKQKEEDFDIVQFEFIRLKPTTKQVIELKDVNSTHELCLAQLGRRRWWNVWGEFIRTSLYVENDIRLLEGANMGEDYQQTPRLSYYANKVAVLHEPLYYYDCTNEGAYSASFKEKTRRQDDQSSFVLWNFFKDKGQEYVDEWKKARLKTLLQDIKGILIVGGHNDFYYDRVACVKKIEKSYYNTIPFGERIMLYLLWSRPLLSLYYKTTTGVLHRVSKIQSYANN